MGALAGVPHPFPYQGSKRQLAGQVLACLPAFSDRLLEPFAGSGAVTIAAAARRRARRFVLNDLHAPLAALWRAILDTPEQLADRYARLWTEQAGQERTFFDRVRAEFNAAPAPHLFLFLLARCVKAAVRYNGSGAFNNSPDNRRLGMRPETLRRNLLRTSALLRDSTTVECLDYQDVLAEAGPEDVVYLDPPYQGVSATRDPRYCRPVGFLELVEALAELNRRAVPFLLSYDGQTGAKVHGRPLPGSLRLQPRPVPAGRSTQATLLGRKQDTIEMLYLSPALRRRLSDHASSGPLFS
jgi:DNA adenine methylase